MLVHTFCIYPPAIKQQKPSSGAKKYIFYKTGNTFFLQKLNEPISSLCHMKGTWCFAQVSTKLFFQGAFYHSREIIQECDGM